jgi:hypothetical protein
MAFSAIEEEVNRQFSDADLNLLLSQPGPVRIEALGAYAQHQTPTFWQLAGNANYRIWKNDFSL